MPAEVLADRPELRGHVGRRIALGIRPEDVEDGPGPDEARIVVTVDIREDMGSEVFLHFALDAPGVKADELRELVGDEAVEAAEVQTHHHGSPFIAKLGRGATAREGEQAVLTLDTGRLHFFSLETGQAI